MDLIKCPKCGHKFELTETLAGPLVAAARAEADAAATVRIAAARKVIEAEAVKKAADGAAVAVESMRQSTTKAETALRESVERERVNAEKLAIAQAAQAEAVRKTRELDEARRELELTVERKTSEGLAVARQAAELAAEERLGARVAEKELAIASMARTIEDLRRKAEQGSQQNQGEAQELALEAALAARFPTDTIEPVGKGREGGDCVQIAISQTGIELGRILWESKQTKAWAAAWLPKLRDDGRAAKADLLVLVTVALPKDVQTFDFVDGVWICAPRYAPPLATALRQALAEVAATRAAGQGLETKAGEVYTYLTGPRFKSRIAAIVEAFTTMKDDLEAERRAITKQWSKRESQIERVLQGTVGMYGDLQSIAGRSLTEIDGLDIAKLEAR